MAVGFAAAFLPPLLTIAIAVFFVLALLLVRHLDYGLVVLVFLFPYLGLVIDLSKVQALREVPFLNQLNAPLVDIFGVVLLAAWLLRQIRAFFLDREKMRGFLPLLKSFFPFFISALVSLINVPALFFSASLKYLARPILFFYLVFFAPTVSIIQQYGKKFLIQIFGVMYMTGLVSALIGFISFFVVPSDGFPRATPFAFWGLAPLGLNHNLLAETLIATAPIGFLLWWLERAHSQGRTRWLLLGSIFQLAIALLTFARTAWIAVAVQLILLVFLTCRGQIKLLLRRAVPALIMIIPLAGYLLWTLSTEIVQSSTLARLDMARIAWFYFLKAPWIGQGVGTFMPTLWGVKAFLLDYGEPLEAHGVIWKLMFEQGIFGLITFFFFVGVILWQIYRAYCGHVSSSDEKGRNRRAVLLAVLLMAVGSFVYQLFNTTYYSSKLWIPVGVAVAAAMLFSKKEQEVL